MAKRVATQLITQGRVARPWLGISGLSLNRSLAEGLGLNVDSGVLVVQVVRGGPAHQAGLRGGHQEVVMGGIRLLLGGDIITEIGSDPISDMKALVHQVEKMAVGETVDLRVIRNGFKKNIRVVLAERP